MTEKADQPVVGVLALQGDFAAHGAAMERLGAEWRPIRKMEQLDDVDGLIIPGGESTTLIKLMDAYDFWAPMRAWIDAGRPVFGTCAGTILLAAEVLRPAQKSLGRIDITVERNSYGRQVDSFEGSGTFRTGTSRSGAQTVDQTVDQTVEEIDMVFIRAPRIVRAGAAVESLGQCRGDTVVARQDHVLVSTFHPELSAGTTLHAYFLQMVLAARP